MTETQAPTQTAAFNKADLAAVVYAVATHAGPLKPEDALEVQQIAQAMIRLLICLPLHSDGQLTVKTLAVEAGLRRNKLTHKNTGLKDLFYALIKAQDRRPKIADRLQQEITALTEKLKEAQADRSELANRVDQCARIIHVLQVENHQLREQCQPGGVVLPLHNRE
ncbi:hypothetical protein ACFWRV_06775 [Streptomyces sp. NPDC058576]|uniref:hypothetical protein n=1 Tax=Streptomyces sp. NPDC058576 TaxID=3346547 RepID=UPI0036538494